MTITDVADYLGLDWKTVKRIDKEALQRRFGTTDYTGLSILAVDEISLRRGHRYLTVVLDYETGRVVWMGEGRRQDTLDQFFRKMPGEQRTRIKAVAMDMWRPYIASVQHWCPRAKIVFDLFHAVRDFNRVIDRVRNQEYRNADEAGKAVIKGSKYLLLKNKAHLRSHEHSRLNAVLKLNKNLATMYILRDYLKELWNQPSREAARQALRHWCRLAEESGIRSAIDFGKKLQRHAYGILNHCDYPINTGRLEGTNNTIKVIKAKAYGFHDTEYFILKVKQAFPGKNQS
jgi:transposase